MSWQDIIKAKGLANVRFDDYYDFQLASEIAEDLNLVSELNTDGVEDNYKERFYLSMDDFNVDIEVNNLSSDYDVNYPTEKFAIRFKSEGKIELYDAEREEDGAVKVFTGNDIVIGLDGSQPEPMKEEDGALIFEITFGLSDYDDGKIYVSIDI